MGFFNIGIPELILVLTIMLVFLGPDKLRESSRNFARFIRKVVRSETWRNFSVMYHEMKHYPEEIMKEVNLEETMKELNEINARTQAELDRIQNSVRTMPKAVDSDSSEPNLSDPDKENTPKTKDSL